MLSEEQLLFYIGLGFFFLGERYEMMIMFYCNAGGEIGRKNKIEDVYADVAMTMTKNLFLILINYCQGNGIVNPYL
jgi:hypothetical protein